MKGQSLKPTTKIEIQVKGNYNKSEILNRTNEETKPKEQYGIMNLIFQAVNKIASTEKSSTNNGSRSKFGNEVDQH